MSNIVDVSSELKKEIFDKINQGKPDELKTILAANKIKLDFVDENNISPLQHACYKGDTKIAQMLIDHGANVNDGQHEHSYTALHFAALSGNPDLCHLLLTHGAKQDATNDVGRTAAQMAAFVGNHTCVVTINNYVPKANIDVFLTTHSPHEEPMLYPHLADSFHSFITQINVHPVRVLINLQKFPGLLDHLPMIQRVLEVMRHKEMTRGIESNEIMSFKYHYLYCIVTEVIKCKKRQQAMKADKNEKEKGTNSDNKRSEDKSEEKKYDVVEMLIKKLLKTKSDGTPEFQELFLREAVREFPYRESAIFRQMVATLASRDPPSAISVVSAAINGQRAFSDDMQICVTCGEENASKKCSKCKMVQYCDRECQRLHWFMHKKTCKRSS